LFIYAQRTADNRIAIGGRADPYHYGSRGRDEFDRDDKGFSKLKGALHSYFPGARGAGVTPQWGGTFAAPPGWFPSVGLDARSGIAWAGGYVGDGVSTSNLGGRTLADLILGRDSDLLRLPWVGHRSRSWEPEPLRWLGITTLGNVVAASADR